MEVMVEQEEVVKKLGKILRTDQDVIRELDVRMSALTGKSGALEALVAENNQKVDAKLRELGLDRHADASTVYNALIRKVEQDDIALFRHLSSPRCSDIEGCMTIIRSAQKLANVPKGFFMKHERAIELLHKNPPMRMIRALGYRDVAELLQHEDLLEVFSALRFAEDREWLNTVFFAPFAALTPGDFEKRDIEVRVLAGKWLKIAAQFLKKKYHNVSHLKELGVIFVIPQDPGTSGETMRLYSLLLHYFHEVTFYSQLFRVYAREEASFMKHVISALRGDVTEEKLHAVGDSFRWRIVQRYLAKDDEYDHRLFEPHVNPEAIHWTKAEQDIARLSKEIRGLGLDFWEDLDFVGDFFRSQSCVDILVSFNLIDTVMSLVEERHMIKYLYHHQEALWNKIFTSYHSEAELEKLVVQNFNRGEIVLRGAQ